MQQCSDNVPPVVRVIVVDGNEIEIRYRGTWADLCRNYVRSLPQNHIAFQEAKEYVDSDRLHIGV